VVSQLAHFYLVWGIMHLTYHPDSDLYGAISPANAGEAGAPEAEIEITPEMMEAGVAAFFGYDSRFDPPEVAVEEIHRAMMHAMTRNSLVKIAAGLLAFKARDVLRERRHRKQKGKHSGSIQKTASR
jgi:hypothetical protein